MHYKYLNVLDEECEYLKNYLTHETKFLDYIKSNAEKQEAKMNSIMKTFDSLDHILGRFENRGRFFSHRVTDERFSCVSKSYV